MPPEGYRSTAKITSKIAINALAAAAQRWSWPMRTFAMGWSTRHPRYQILEVCAASTV